ncbi:hypothetical protein MMC07_009807 [Pseudocyphellaria aurata]|nr:hypothetical protein [Pseudocyphellaria aurata]
MAKTNTERAKDAPIIRQLFSSSPRDPRYHMLSYISHKFSQELRPQSHEPRAALFLNRFTRTLTIMYATNGLASLLGISADELNGKSFYYCIQENCLQEAVRCLESAKANDSIAYLRFWFRDPRQDDQTDHDEHMENGHSSGDEDDGGVHLSDRMDEDCNDRQNGNYAASHSRSSMDHESSQSMDRNSMAENSRSSSGNSTDDTRGNDTVFDRPAASHSSSSSLSASEEGHGRQSFRRPYSPGPSQIELEAVVSCTSDGLVVILRKARSFVPPPSAEPVEHPYANGFFASPWGINPILPDTQCRSNCPQPPWVLPPNAPPEPTAAQAHAAAVHGPASEDFMNSIREVAVFAWALTGINGSLAQYSRGKSTGESQPPGGLPIWVPNSNAGPESEPYNMFGDNSKWKDTNDDQNRDRSHHGSNSNGIGNGNGNGHYGHRNGHGNSSGNCVGKSYEYAGMAAAANGGDSSSWMLGRTRETMPWDRVYANQPAGCEVRRHDEMRRIGQ